MEKFVEEIYLDVGKRNLNKYIIAKQGDKKSRYIKVTIQANGQKIAIDTGVTAKLRAIKPDGKSVYYPAEINADGTITAELTGQVLAASGIVDADIELVSENGEKLSTLPFKIDVERAQLGMDTSESKNEFAEIEEAIKRAEEILKQPENDSTEDYKISGANSVQEWATMADVGNTNSYRVREGRYRVTVAGDVYTVRIVDSTYTSTSTSWTVRRVGIVSGDDEANVYVDVYTCNAPGTQIHHVLGVCSDGSAIVISGKRYPLVTSPETAGNILTAVKNAAGIVVPQWAKKPTYTADEINATVSYGNETAKNVQYALDMLAANLAKVNIPAVTAADNGAFMQVVNGKWAAAQLTDVSEVGA